jgi:hypothetical protein
MTKSLIYEMVENKIIFIRDFIEEKVRGNKWITPKLKVI